MKVLSLVMSIFLATTASAAPCFFPGTYKGMGIAKDASGKTYSYEVETAISDSTKGSSRYKWAEGGKAEFAFEAATGGVLLINGKDIGATVKCDLATEEVKMPLGNGLVLNETWLFAGNYLLRNGQKGTPKGQIEYQELLIREK